MNWLQHFTMGNIPGFLGMILFIWAACILARRHPLPGTLLVIGSLLVLLSRFFITFIAPQMEYIRVMEFNPHQIALMDSAPVVAITLGSVLVVFGILLINLRAKTLRDDLIKARIKK